MNHLQTLVPLAVLIAVGALLIIVARRMALEKGPAIPPEKPAIPPVIDTPVATAETPVAVEVVVVQKMEAPSLVTPTSLQIPTPDPYVQEEAIPDKPRRKKPIVSAVVKVVPPATTIERVVGLLKEKDTIAAAFLLREILAPPASKRP